MSTIESVGRAEEVFESSECCEGAVCERAVDVVERAVEVVERAAEKCGTGGMERSPAEKRRV